MSIPSIRQPVPVLLPVMFLVLAGCDRAPLAMGPAPDDVLGGLGTQTAPAPTPAMQCTNNLMQLGLSVSPVLHIIAPMQVVEDDEGREWRFRAHLHGWEGEDSTPDILQYQQGWGHVRLEGDEVVDLWVYEVEQDRLLEAGVLTFEGEAIICTDRRRDCRTETTHGTVEWNAHQGVGPQPLRWTFQGGVEVEYSGVYTWTHEVVSPRDGPR
jgi:hypothetical protein